jgi:hypothetical protein
MFNPNKTSKNRGSDQTKKNLSGLRRVLQTAKEEPPPAAAGERLLHTQMKTEHFGAQLPICITLFSSLLSFLILVSIPAGRALRAVLAGMLTDPNGLLVTKTRVITMNY